MNTFPLPTVKAIASVHALRFKFRMASVPQDGLTALIYAVRRGNTETVSVLLEAGADVNLQEKVSEPIVLTLKFNNINCCTNSTPPCFSPPKTVLFHTH